MRISKNCIEKVTVVPEESKRILNAICIGPVTNPAENDFLNYDLKNIFVSDDFIIEKDKNIMLKSGEQHKAFYINKADEFNIGIDFSDYKFKDTERFFIFANIFSSNNNRVIFRFGKKPRMKVWLNNTLIFNGYGSIFEGYFVLTALNKGNNLICAEYLSTNEQQGEVFSISISELGNEPTQIENEFMEYFLKQRVESRIQVICESCCFYGSSYKLLLIPMDFLRVDSSRTVKISVCDSSQIEIDQINGHFFQIISIDTSKYSKDDFFYLNIFYFDVDGTERMQKHVIVNSDFLENMNKSISNYELFFTKLFFNEAAKILYMGLLNDLKRAGNQLRDCFISNNSVAQSWHINQIIYFYSKLKSIVSSSDLTVTVNEHLNQKETGIDIYYKSKLDESIKKYIVCVPESYSLENKYPIIIHLEPEVNRYGQAFYSQLPSELSEDVIFANISTRNVTLGSYIGEAGILEAIDEIKKTFSIDENRIYLIGYSNSAYACWGLIQAYPHVFTAIAPLSGGLYSKNLKNIFYTPFFAVFGEKEHSGIKELVPQLDQWIDENKNHVSSKVVMFKDSDHYTFQPVVIGSKLLIEWLLKQRKQCYYTKSYFRTERIRHSGNEWVQITAVEKNSDFCEFDLEVKSNSHIVIRIVNAQEFVLKLPDYIKKDNLVVTVNGKHFPVSKLNGNKNLYFSKYKENYSVSANIHKQRCSSWGMGILDIYMDTLKIVIPSAFSSLYEENIFNKIAKNFSQPKSLGYDPNIDVKYTIIKDDFSQSIMENSNIILIGCRNNNQFINTINQQLKIQMYDDGYFYNGTYYSGEYCILFIQPNPIFPEKKILVVYSNSLELLKRNFFLKKFIIPSYFNGLHPYLNCEVIVFDGKVYTVADVLDNEIYSPNSINKKYIPMI